MRKLFKNPLFSGSFLMVGGSLVVNAINYVYHLVMGRLLGPVDYGTLSSLFSVLYMISIVPISSSFAIVKFISEAKGEVARQTVYISVKKFVWKIAGVGMFLLLISSPLLSDFLHIKELESVLLIGPIFFLSLIILVDQAAMQGLLKFVGVVGPNLVSALSKLVLGVFFVLLGFSVTGAISGVLLGLVMTYFVTLKIRGSLFSKSTKKDFKILEFLRYALPVLLQALAFTSIFTVDVILAKHFLSPFDAGLYAALSTLGKIVYFATQPVTATMFPIVSGRRARGEKFKSIFWGALFVTVATSFAIVGFYYLFPDIAIGILYGESFLSAAKELVWMGIFIGLYSVSYLIVNFVLSVGRTRVVILPVLAGVGQTVGIIVWHSSILQIIQVSLVAILALFSALVVYLVAQWAKSGYSLS